MSLGLAIAPCTVRPSATPQDCSNRLPSLAAEAFVVCQNYTPPPGFYPSQLRALLTGADMKDATPEDSDPACIAASRLIIPFVACGDLSGWDADRSYSLEPAADGKGYVSLPPVQPPIAPPYKTAREEETGRASSSK